MDASDFTNDSLIGWVAKADRWSQRDTAADRFHRAAQAHIQAGQLWHQASLAYRSGDAEAAKAMYNQATDASARAHDAADQASMI
jgi:hypothetical protein